MEIEKIDLNDDDTKVLSDIDATIRQRSLEHMDFVLRIRALESQAAEMHDARRQFMLDKIKASGLDAERVRNVNIGTSGPENNNLSLTVVLEPKPKPDEKPEDVSKIQ